MTDAPRHVLLPGADLVVGDHSVEASVAHHIQRVLRVRPGTRLSVGDGRGAVGQGEWQGSGVLRIESVASLPQERPPIALWVAVGTRNKLDGLIRRAVELGASEIHPLWTDRSVGESARRTERWQAIADDGTRVSERPYRAVVSAPVTFADARVIAGDRATLKVFGERSAAPFADGVQGQASVAGLDLWIGPEGGFSPEEQAVLAAIGARPVSFGPHNLRMETAGTAAVALAADLRHRGLLAARDG